MDVIALWLLQLNIQLQLVLNMCIKINASFYLKKKIIFGNYWNIFYMKLKILWVAEVTLFLSNLCITFCSSVSQDVSVSLSDL